MSQDSKRLSDMRRLRAEGLTLAAIGSRYGISRQRVQQLIGNTGYAATKKAPYRNIAYAVAVAARKQATLNRHDYGGYRRGCRCDVCRRANTDWHRRARERRALR